MPRALLSVMEPPSLARAGGGTHGHIQLHALLRAGWEVTLIIEMATAADRPAFEQLGQLGVEVFAGRHAHGLGDPYVGGTGDWLARGRFDLAVVQSWHLGERYAPVIRSHAAHTRLIVDMGDLFLLRLVRSRFGADDDDDRRLSDADGRELVRELNAYAAADAVLAVTDTERRFVDLMCKRPGLAHLFPLSRAARQPPRPGFRHRRGMLFLGSFNHPPNVEGVKYLCEEVLPLLPPELLAEHPLRLVGYKLEGEIAHELGKHRGVVPVGWLPTLEDELDRARLFVAPLLTGAGVKNKLLDAFANRLPVVTTTIGIEGMELEPEREIGVADGARALAGEIERVLTDEHTWETLAEGGYQWLQRTTSPERTAAAFMNAVAEAMKGEPRAVEELAFARARAADAAA